MSPCMTAEVASSLVRPVQCLIISDDNLLNLAAYLNAAGGTIRARVSPFGQVVPTLLNTTEGPWSQDTDAVVVWTQPQSVVPAFRKLLGYERVSPDDLLEEVDAYCALFSRIPEGVASVLVPSWVVPPYHRGWGLLDRHPGIGVSDALSRMNLRLSENLRGNDRVFVLDSSQWIRAAGRKAFNPTLWYTAKVPFGNEVFQEAARDIQAAIGAIRGGSRKLLLVDLDDTLWGGIVGEVGWQNIRLGGHDPVGEAYVDFQRSLKGLLNRGILLAMVSKNDETAALEALDRHPEMILGRRDFVAWRINWRDKAENIIDLVSELNLGLQSAVFIDDNAVERSRVAEALPEVFVPPWPANPLTYTSALHELRCFDTPSLTNEDVRRAQMYATDRRRRAEIGSFLSVENWLESLKIRIQVEELSDENLDRTAQLFNKTNQMNLTTRRLTPPQLRDWAGQERHKLWSFRVSDRLGDSGLTGILGLETHDGRAVVSDFVLSCRVIGRKVEEAMLATAIDYCKSIGLTELTATYIPTPKSGPCLAFYRRSGLEETSAFTFRWLANEPYELPAYVEVIRSDTSGHSPSVCLTRS
jgi:FkbH-like protein